MRIWSAIRNRFFPKTKTLDDAVLGQLCFYPNRKFPDASFWAATHPGTAGTVHDLLPVDDNGEFIVYAGEEGPTQEQRETATKLGKDWPSLRMELEREMYDDYLTFLEIAGPTRPDTWSRRGFPDVQESKDVWRNSRLVIIEIPSERKVRGEDCEVYLHFDVDWEEEHGRRVRVANSHISDYIDE